MDEQFLREAIRLAMENVESGHGGPFGAVIVRDGTVVATGQNRVTPTNDPTAHAEITAIRAACAHLGTFSLQGCEIYVNCEPCPMCLGAIYWARLDRLVYAATADDAAAIGFDDAHIYHELRLPPDQRALPTEHALREEALPAFNAWREKPDKTAY